MIKEFVKRDGRMEEFNASKALGWGKWGARGFSKYIDWQAIVVATVAQMPARCTSKEFNAGLIRNALNTDTWAGQLMAGRIYATDIHKEVFGGKKRRTLREIHTTMQAAGVMVTLNYSDDEYAMIEKMIDHERDFHCAHYQLKQGRDKYALRNRTTGRVYESRQLALARVAMVVCEPHDPITRMARLESMYSDFYSERLSAPTPNHNNMGTGHNGFFSCCLFTCSDTKESIGASSVIAEVMTYMSAGLGENMQVRSLGEPIRNGLVIHSGKTPYYNKQFGIVKSNKQGPRGGSLNEFFSAYDPEVKSIMVLKNPRTPINKRQRGIDYTMMLNRWLLHKSSLEENVFLFNVYTAPDLCEAMYGKDLAKFVEIYQKYENDPEFEKTWVSARELVVSARSEGFETGRFYLAMIDEINYHTPHRDSIRSSNLCVAPESLLLTINGHQTIKDLAGTTATVWNGREWSDVQVIQTGAGQQLLTVTLDDGRSLDCTTYHKFYIRVEDEVVETRAHELKPGDKVIKSEIPSIEGYKDHTTLEDDQAEDPVFLHDIAIKDPLFVPDASWTLQYRMDWLNLHESHNKVIVPDPAITDKATANKFLKDVQNMAQTLSIDTAVDFELMQVSLISSEDDVERYASVVSVIDEGRLDDTYCVTEPKRNMAVFNGILTGQCVEITQPTWHYDNLLELYSHRFLGYVSLTNGEGDNVILDSNVPVEIKGIEGAVAAIELTVGCQYRKVGQFTYNTVSAIHESRREPEVSLCALAAIIPTNIHTEEQYAETAYNALYMIDFCIDHNHYPLPHMKLTAQARRNAGVGLMDVAHYMAQRKLSYNSQEGMMELHRIAERHAYHLINASIRLGEERGNAEWIHKTEWPRGWTPQATYNRNVDTLAPFVNQYDWADVSRRLIENKGCRNSSLIAHMPGESSSKYSACSNSIMDLRELSITKTDADNTMLWVAPEADTLKDYYSIAWNRTRLEHTKTYSIFQKWADQSISADWYAVLNNHEKISSSELIEETNALAFYGQKTVYYTNTDTSNKEALATMMTRTQRYLKDDDDGLDVSGPACTSGGCSV